MLGAFRACKAEGEWDNMWDCICECVTNITTRFDAVAGNKQNTVFDVTQPLNCHVKVPGAVAGESAFSFRWCTWAPS